MFISSFRSLSACNCHSILCVPQTGQPAPNTCDTIAQEDVFGTSSLKIVMIMMLMMMMMMILINRCLFVLIERFRVTVIASDTYPRVRLPSLESLSGETHQGNRSNSEKSVPTNMWPRQRIS